MESPVPMTFTLYWISPGPVLTGSGNRGRLGNSWIYKSESRQNPLGPTTKPPVASFESHDVSYLDDSSEWSQAKALIRPRISEIAFQNWFADSWQVDRSGDTLIVAILDEP